MANATKLSTWDGFQSELAKREQEIASLLPNHINRARFMSAIIAAVKQTPGLLSCTPRSLFAALTKSATDGLLADGREGVITIYREKQKDESLAQIAQWNPMTFGLRKRARELDGIIVDAQVVHENDQFVWHQGDEPKLEHKPAMLGTGRGAMIGVYAIFRASDGSILSREVMDADQISSVRSQSKQPDGLMWTKFASEAWRKVVIRRGFKSIPCSEKLQTIVERDDNTYSFDKTESARDRPKATVISAVPAGQRRSLPPVAGEQPMPMPEFHTRDGTDVAMSLQTNMFATVEPDKATIDVDLWVKDAERRLQECSKLGELAQTKTDVDAEGIMMGVMDEAGERLMTAFIARKQSLAKSRE